MLALAQALGRAGHEAIVACPARFEVWVRSLGVEHRALGEDLSALMAEKGGSLERSLAGDAVLPHRAAPHSSAALARDRRGRRRHRRYRDGLVRAFSRRKARYRRARAPADLGHSLTNAPAAPDALVRAAAVDERALLVAQRLGPE